MCAAVESDDHGEDPSLAVDTETELSTKKRQPSSERAEENPEEKSEDKKENSLSFSNTNFDPVAKRDDLPKGDKPVIKGESGCVVCFVEFPMGYFFVIFAAEFVKYAKARDGSELHSAKMISRFCCCRTDELICASRFLSSFPVFLLGHIGINYYVHQGMHAVLTFVYIYIYFFVFRVYSFFFFFFFLF